jgi:LPXTG-motif cell wall-anchored protein
MKNITRCLSIVCVLAASLFVVPSVSADDWNRKTKVTFNQPVEVPGVGAQILPAGTYVFKIMDSSSDRHIVQIFNEDMTHVFTTILAIPNYRLRATDKTVITFRERAVGEPEAVRAWFYPGHEWGEEFVYPKAKAVELAKIINEPVLFTPVEIATVEALKTAPIEAVKPTGEAVPVAEVVQAPPVEVAKVEALPHTASNLPLLALAGLLALGAAGVMFKYQA